MSGGREESAGPVDRSLTGQPRTTILAELALLWGCPIYLLFQSAVVFRLEGSAPVIEAIRAHQQGATS